MSGPGFGINIKKYICVYEAAVRAKLVQPLKSADLQEILDEHLIKITWLQHERLVHLLVTILFAIFLLFLIGLMLTVTVSAELLILAAVTTVMLVAYIFHYFRLENSVQRWYLLADQIRARMKAE